MKKLISAFLAVLMVVSLFFAFPAQAAQLKKTEMELQSVYQKEETVCADQKASETANLGGAQAADAPRAAGTGEETAKACNHTFRAPQYYSGNLHKRVCSKCGYTRFESHGFRKTYINTASHIRYCAACGYSVTEDHAFSDSISGNTHKRVCSGCGYNTTHTGIICNPSTVVHLKTCRLCGYAVPEAHNFDQTFCCNSSQHFNSCTKCGFCFREDHSFSAPVCLDDSAHRQICMECYCNHDTPHTLGDAVIVDDYTHKQYCSDCNAEIISDHNLILYFPYYVGDEGNLVDVYWCTDCHEFIELPFDGVLVE